MLYTSVIYLFLNIIVAIIPVEDYSFAIHKGNHLFLLSWIYHGSIWNDHNGLTSMLTLLLSVLLLCLDLR